jgi:hypothetical protein
VDFGNFVVDFGENPPQIIAKGKKPKKRTSFDLRPA